MNTDVEEIGLSKLTDILESAITGVPAPVRKNFLKALGQLCTAAVDLPVAWLEGKSDEIRANTKARVQIIEKGGHTISEQIIVPQEYIDKASIKFASKIIKEQSNLDQITLIAANELTNKEIKSKAAPADDISEDWLNEFENLARLKSSESMKFIFGKILSSEIVKPGSFSIKTLKVISQLDNEAAKLFQLFCSQTISMRVSNHIFDARVVSFDGSAASNSLQKYGLSFSSLNILQEYGLIISDYNSSMEYSPCIAIEQNQAIAILRYRNKNFTLVSTDLEKHDKTLKLNGVALTNAGQELLDVILPANDNNYETEFLEFLKKKHLELVEIN